MPIEVVRQGYPPMAGANPLWLEERKQDSGLTKVLSLVALLVLISVAVLTMHDYLSTKDPNASECMVGFTNDGCPAGYKCVGAIVNCIDTGERFQHWVTRVLLPEKTCVSPHIYKEFCVKENTTSDNNSFNG